MLKSLVWTILLLGFIGIFIYQPAGIVLLCFCFLIILIFIGNKDPEIIEEWSVLIKNAQGSGDRILAATQEKIIATKAPRVELVEESVGPSLSKTTWGDTRNFLIVIDKIGLKFRRYKIFVNAIDYGNNLFASWYLTHKPDWWESILLLMPGAKQVLNLGDLNLFDRQDVTAYTTNVHRCFQEAVDAVILDLKQDPSKIDRKSRGFLGIS